MTRLIPAADVPPEALHAAFGEAFADYVAGPFTLGLAQWPGFLARQCVSLPLSRVSVGPDDQPRAFALVAERPARQRWRLATMGALPGARGQGDAAALLQDLVSRAAAAGQHALELEVFAQNPRAVALYERHGFQRIAALHGHAAAPLDGPAAAGDPAWARSRAEALAWLAGAEDRLPQLPLQLGARVLAQAEGWTAWQRGSAQIVFDASGEGGLVIRSLVDADPRQDDALALALALRRAHPGRGATLPPLLPDAIGGEALRRAGFERQPLHQWWMQRDLAGR